MNVFMDKFMSKILADSGKKSLLDIEGVDFEAALSKYLTKRSDVEEKAHGCLFAFTGRIYSMW